MPPPIPPQHHQQDSFRSQLLLQQTPEIHQLRHHLLTQLEPHPLLSTNVAADTNATQSPQQPVKKRPLNAPSFAGHGSSSSRTALRSATVGEIVEVQGGHIMRSTGRKDRHSKVYTAKGPRDRRVRLSALTAIQFYDVQDRLGYDRPSKAVDWLMKKAKAAIDELDELPAWKPTTALTKNDDNSESLGGEEVVPEKGGGGGGGGIYVGNNVDSSNLLAPSMDSDSIADTIKTFFPIGGEATAAHATATSSVSVGMQSVRFQSYPSADLLPRRASSHSQDLKLSLQSFQDPMMIQSQHRPQHSHQNQEEQQRSRFPGAAHVGFYNPSADWDETQQADMGRFQRLIGWNLDGDGYGGGSGRGGFMLLPPQSLQQPLFFGHGVGHNATHSFSQGGPLQSNSTPLVRASIGDNSVVTATSNHDHHHHNQTFPIHPVSLSGIGFTSLGGFSSFQIQAQIQGDEKEQDGNPNKPSSVPSGSHR